eukprot:TRINITY_DN5131_c0_g1_i1.p1 TRINITY_DN5131_c0_g1~~TRINITY_DN5131_c0_g1_i1.p1  ORF type:complete len:236 (+),score=45.00 TRINITY_DN5131_c0_g1_i1:59-709(+)
MYFGIAREGILVVGLPQRVSVGAMREMGFETIEMHVAVKGGMKNVVVVPNDPSMGLEEGKRKLKKFLWERCMADVKPVTVTVKEDEKRTKTAVVMLQVVGTRNLSDNEVDRLVSLSNGTCGPCLRWELGKQKRKLATDSAPITTLYLEMQSIKVATRIANPFAPSLDSVPFILDDGGEVFLYTLQTSPKPRVFSEHGKTKNIALPYSHDPYPSIHW